MSMGKRKPNGASSIYEGNDGWWHGRVTVGTCDNGKPDRRHVRGRTESAVIKKVRILESARDAGRTSKPGQKWTLTAWLTHWVENIAAPYVRENTLSSYRVAINKHLIPGVGQHRLDKLEPEHLERLYVKMTTSGSAPATAHQVHRTIRTALGEAVRRGHVHRNVAQLARAPRIVHREIAPYGIDEIKRLLIEAGKRRNAARWAIALSLGLRQGEALGLMWSDVDLENGTLVVRRARQRPKWKHGCDGDCGHKHAGYCPQRTAIRALTAETKTRAGMRTIGLPAALVQLLEGHQREQQRERFEAGQLWNEGGWIFTSPTGEPVNPRTDYDDWKALLKVANLRDGRLHDARHTAATVLLLLRVPERTVMDIMGWSNTSMAANYQHVTAPIRDDVARRVDALLWGPGSHGEDDDGAIGVLPRLSQA